MTAATTILVDERDAAAALGLQPRTLAVWRSRGDGPPHVRISSRCVRYRVADLEAWAAERVRTSTADPGPRAA
ncbi:MAG: helix-turn-helix domain-containing protein [Gemmatimonadota bacterium]